MGDQAQCPNDTGSTCTTTNCECYNIVSADTKSRDLMQESFDEVEKMEREIDQENEYRRQNPDYEFFGSQINKENYWRTAYRNAIHLLKHAESK